jgi:Ca-activated chloride channel family protein
MTTLGRVRWNTWFVVSLLLVAGVESRGQLSAARPGPATAGSPGPETGEVVVDIPNLQTGAATRMLTLRANADLVLVPVTVTDRMNHPVMGLHKEDFTVLEQERPRDVRYFSAEDGPISVGLILDLSKSMMNKIDVERAAVAAFFNYANPEDDYFAISVSTTPRLIATATQSINSIESKVGMTEPDGGTALLDGIYLGIAQMRTAQYPRHALVIISDGGDNSSHYHLSQIKETLRESDVATYAIGIFDAALFKTFEEYMGRQWLEEITDATGGRTIAVDQLDAVPVAAAAISWELRNQYVLGFRPDSVDRGKWHKIRVRVTSPSSVPSVQAHYRRGYFVP